MRQRVATVTEDALRDVDLECTHCGVLMSCHQSAASKVRYFRCSCCQRWVSSTYAEILRADAKMRAQPRADTGRAAPQIENLKSRLDRWLAAVEDQDPYRLLGVSPVDSQERIRSRYRELALQCHPDRGGSPEKMQQINAAYERITIHRERRAAERRTPRSSSADMLAGPGF
jgi:hypothetical protein